MGQAGRHWASGVIEEGRVRGVERAVSLPFPRPDDWAKATWRVAVKVIDPRGNEGLRVVTMAA